jgi:hypothetical protein
MSLIVPPKYTLNPFSPLQSFNITCHLGDCNGLLNGLLLLQSLAVCAPGCQTRLYILRFKSNHITYLLKTANGFFPIALGMLFFERNPFQDL